MVHSTSISDVSEIGDGPVLVHSDALNTLRLVPRNRNVSELADSHIHIIDQLADGRSVWMPSFNYSFPSSRIYDVENDPSEVGLISERFRNRAAWRTTTPIFNFSGNGEKPETNLINGKEIDPFGPDSSFGTLTGLNGSILWYGAPIASATILHFVESRNKGPLYRYDKYFPGLVSTQNQTVDVELKFHVRPRGGPLGYDWPRLNSDAFAAGVIQRIKLEVEADIFVCNAAHLADFWAVKFSADPFYFLDSESRKWTQPLIERLGRRLEINDFEENLS